MRRLLPLSTPPLMGYLHHAFPLSILAGKRPFLPWLYSQYIQLSCPGHYDFERAVKHRFENVKATRCERSREVGMGSPAKGR